MDKNNQVVFGMPDTVLLPTGAIKELLDNHLKDKRARLSLGLFPTSTPKKFGMIKIDKDNNVIYHNDKPKKSDAKLMWGITVWEPEFSEQIHKYLNNHLNFQTEPTFGDMIDLAIEKNEIVKAYQITQGKYYDIGTYDEYKKALLEL